MAGVEGTAPGPSTTRRLPHLPPRSARTRLAVVALPLGLLSAASVVGSLLAPRLLATHPLLVAALCPRTVHLAVAAGAVPLPAFLAVGLARLAAADPWHYALGRMHGSAAAAALARRSPVLGRWAAWLVSAGEGRSLVAVALSPTGKVLMVAGAARLRPWRVALADAAGTLVQLVAVYASGRPLVAALGPSPAGLAGLSLATLLAAAAGPGLLVRTGRGTCGPGPPALDPASSGSAGP